MKNFNVLLQELRQKYPKVSCREPDIDVKDMFSLPPQVKTDYNEQGISLSNHYTLDEPYLEIWLDVSGDKLYSNQNKVRDIYTKGKEIATETGVWADFTPKEFEKETEIPLKHTYSLRGSRSLWLEFRPDEIFNTFEISNRVEEELIKTATDIYKELKETRSLKVLEKAFGDKVTEEQEKSFKEQLKSKKNLPWGTAQGILGVLIRKEYEKGNIEARKDYQPKTMFEKDPMSTHIGLQYTRSLESEPIIKLESPQALSEKAKEIADKLELNMYEIGLSSKDMERVAEGFGKKSPSGGASTFVFSAPSEEIGKIEEILGRKLNLSEIEYRFKFVKMKNKKSREENIEDLRKGFRMLEKVTLPENLNHEPNKLWNEVTITLQAKNVPSRKLPKVGKIDSVKLETRKKSRSRFGSKNNLIDWKYNSADEEDELMLRISLTDPRLLPLQAELCNYFGILPK